MPNQFDPGNQKHVVSKGGTKFITFLGLQLKLADMGRSVVGTDFEEVESVMGEDNNGNPTCVYLRGKGTITVMDNETKERYTYSGVGDAAYENLGPMVKVHLPRMAETRSYVRALRFATRSEYTAREELGGDE